MLSAGRVGQILNLSSLADDAGISHKIAGERIPLLETSVVFFRLPPFPANINRRLIESPRLCFYDPGGLDGPYMSRPVDLCSRLLHHSHTI